MLNFSPILFLVSGLSFYLELSDETPYADTVNKVLLWMCSLGSIVVVLANAALEVFLGDWRAAPLFSAGGTADDAPDADDADEVEMTTVADGGAQTTLDVNDVEEEAPVVADGGQAPVASVEAITVELAQAAASEC